MAIPANHANQLLLYLRCVRAQGFRTWTHRWLFVSAMLIVGSLVFSVQALNIPILERDLLSGAALPHSATAKKLWIGALWVVTTFAIAWIDSLRLGGWTLLRSLPKLFLIQIGSKRTMLALFIFIGGVYSYDSVSALIAAIHPYAPNLILIMCVAAPLILFRPPVALVLTSSSSNANNFLTIASFSLFPLRVVAMLDSKKVALSNHMFGEDNIRAVEVVDWKKNVKALMDILPILLIDGRDSSPVVSEELQWILASSARAQKAILVTDDRGKQLLSLDSASMHLLLGMLRCPLMLLPEAIWKR